MSDGARAGKVAVDSSGASGIRLATASPLANESATIFIADLADENGALVTAVLERFGALCVPA